MRNKTNLQRHDALFWGNLDEQPSKRFKISKEEIMLYIEIAIFEVLFLIALMNY